MISNVYEIHKYEHDRFQCVVTMTNKYDEHKVIKDTEEMNSMLSQEAKSQGIRYILAIVSMSDKQDNAQEKSESNKRTTIRL